MPSVVVDDVDSKVGGERKAPFGFRCRKFLFLPSFVRSLFSFPFLGGGIETRLESVVCVGEVGYVIVWPCWRTGCVLGSKKKSPSFRAHDKGNNQVATCTVYAAMPPLPSIFHKTF